MLESQYYCSQSQVECLRRNKADIGAQVGAAASTKFFSGIGEATPYSQTTKQMHAGLLRKYIYGMFAVNKNINR